MPAPFRIVTDRLVIRCWEPEDAGELKRVIDTNIEHLLPWMPWAQYEPETLAEKTLRLRNFQRMFQNDEDNVYGIFDPTDTEVLGGTGLHPRSGPESREIGYWISSQYEGQGLITESSAALTRVCFEVMGLDRVEIHCDPRNVRSAAVPERLGFEHEATLRRRIADADGTLHDAMIWSLFAEDYEDSPAAEVPIQAYDELGERLL